MSDRDAFLAAIAAAPEDDAPRLVYADWLDENGDPERAELIRVQCEIDPLRRLPDTDAANWQRATVTAHLDAPVPSDFPPAMQRFAALARREQTILRAHKGRWIGRLSDLKDDDATHLSVEFRRGFVDEIAMAAAAFLDAGKMVREACPMLRRLTLYGPRDQGPDLMAASTLSGIQELELAGWLTPFDARFLSISFAIHSAQSLVLWIGSRGDEEVLRTLATEPYVSDEYVPQHPDSPLLAGPWLGKLREVVLVQLHGGLQAGEVARAIDRRADALAAKFNEIVGRTLARVDRPFARRFPLGANLGYNLYAGHLRQGGPVLVCAGRRPVLLHFDTDGRLVREEMLDLSTRLSRPGRFSWETYDPTELLTVLQRDYGFALGTIFVREFESRRADVSVFLWGTFEDTAADPDRQPEGDEHTEACASLDSYWRKGGNFVISAGNDYWAGPDGKIHTS